VRCCRTKLLRRPQQPDWCLPQQVAGPLVLLLSLVMGICIDAVNGFPGAGVYTVGVVGPAIAVGITASNPLLVLLSYVGCIAVYMGWVILDTWIVGLWPDVLSPNGGNFPGILQALVGTALPVLLVPAGISYAAAASAGNSRRQLQAALRVSQAAGRSYSAVVQLLRALMPPFAMQCLTNGIPAFETEACIVVVHIAVLPGDTLSLSAVDTGDAAGARNRTPDQVDPAASGAGTANHVSSSSLDSTPRQIHVHAQAQAHAGAESPAKSPAATQPRVSQQHNEHDSNRFDSR